MNRVYLSIIPFYYTFSKRLNNLFLIGSFILSYIIPIFILSFELKYKENILIFTFNVLLNIAAYTSIYEIGYIMNDVITVKREKEPTIRLCEHERRSIEENIVKICFSKIMISLLLFEILKKINHVNNYKYILVILATLIIYCIHNLIRDNRINFFTFMFLSFLKFVSPIYLLYGVIDEKIIAQIFLYLVIIRNFELIGKKYRFLSINFYKIKDKFRVFFYFFIIIFTFIFKLEIKDNIVLFYLFVYRLMGYLIIRSKKEG